jgi:hypothetical protein
MIENPLDLLADDCPEPRFVVEGAGPAPKRKNPTPAKIVPDGENYAVQWYGMLLACPEHERQALLVHNALMRWRGVGSLIAERDALKAKIAAMELPYTKCKLE